jgi:hypothetical protein
VLRLRDTDKVPCAPTAVIVSKVILFYPNLLILVAHRPKAFGFVRNNMETTKMRVPSKNFLWFIKRQ